MLDAHVVPAVSTREEPVADSSGAAEGVLRGDEQARGAWSRGPTRVVALDGPAGSGKSTVAKHVAAALGWRFVDTGATYRAVTLAVLRAGIEPGDAAGVLSVARAVAVELVSDPGDARVLLDGDDVSREIRSPEVTAAVSAVAAVPAVRTLLIELQRSAMGNQGSVTEGRDIATVVAPDAAVKVYLDASMEVRARRRAAETSSGVKTKVGERLEDAVAADLSRRDQIDSATNAFVPSDGAVHLDTSNLSLDQVVLEIVAMVDRAGIRTP